MMPRGTVGKPRMCFVSHNAWGELSGQSGGHIGGVERQTALMARWFAAAGWAVSMATWDERRGASLDTGGVEHIPLCRRDAGLPGLRFIHPRWTSLNRALRAADADVYYHNCGEYVTGQVALWCRRQGRKFVYSTANDTDVHPDLPELRTVRERVLYRYGLRSADAIVTQTEMQRRMLRDGFGRESVVIPMPCPGPRDAYYVPPSIPTDRPPSVLWIGRLCRQKRPDRLVEVARRRPSLHFDLVGPVYPSDYARRVREQAEATENITVHGPVARTQLGRLYRRASCMLSTSDFEGFPNTFLEAWSFGLPVISTFDPDGLIASRGLGAAVDDVEAMIEALDDLLSSPQRHRGCSRRAREYYNKTHAVAAVMPRFRQVFADVLGSASQ